VLKFDAANWLWTSLTCRALLISSVVVGAEKTRFTLRSASPAEGLLPQAQVVSFVVVR
jgi:hypothetical protein